MLRHIHPKDFFEMLKEQYRRLEVVRSHSSLEDVMPYHIVRSM